MDELIGRLAIKASIDRVVAEKSVGIILGFLHNKGPSGKVQALIDEIPSAEAAIAASGSGGFIKLKQSDQIRWTRSPQGHRGAA